MRACNRCGLSKEIAEFGPLKTGRDGLHPSCRSCMNAYARADRLARGNEIRQAERDRHAANPDRKREQFRKWSAKNAEARRIKERERYAKRRADALAQKAGYRAKNREKIYALNGNRRALLRKALPKWVDRKALAAIYAEAASKTEVLGVQHHVDHDIPLSHPLVCGLHVPWNLAIVTADENLTKSNRWL